MSFEQASSLLNSIHDQVTGETTLPATNTQDFISVANNTLRAGYDPVLGAITQMVNRTIFSNRPYRGKLGGLMVDNAKFGSITRKLALVDKDFENNNEYALIDGLSLDMYKVNKPEVLQLNYYGAVTWKRHYTIFRNQLDNAFRGPEEFASFMTMVTQNNADVIEQAMESQRRIILANFIAGKYAANNSVLHLLTEYNSATGLSLTSQTVMQPQNFPGFVQWVYARIEQISSMMTERSQKFQINITGKAINRHTPRQDQRVYLNAQVLSEFTARVLADVYHDNFLTLAETEGVNYWQAIDTPYEINIAPTYLDSTGAVTTAAAQNVKPVFGIIFDRDAMGMTIMDNYASTTPFNSEGDYWNQYFSFTGKWYSDFSEKAVVLLLD